MRLRQVHQLLIASAIGLCAVFALRGAVLWRRGEGTVHAAMAAGAVVVGVALAFYLRAVRRKWAKD